MSLERKPARVLVTMTLLPSLEKPCVSHHVVSCTTRRAGPRCIPDASTMKSATITSHARDSLDPHTTRWPSGDQLGWELVADVWLNVRRVACEPSGFIA